MGSHSLPFYTMDDFAFEGKKVLLRVDINSPIDPKTGAIIDDTRIKSHAKTVKELVRMGASVAILAHQGRPGDSDFTNLEAHGELLSRYLDIEVKYVEDIFGPYARSEISKMRPGDVLLLENTRFYSEENIEKVPEAQAKTFLVRRLSPLFSVYVNDAFATSHRSHPSLVGFPVVMPSAGGRLLEAEVGILSSLFKPSSKPCVFVLGGGKVSDSVQLMETLLPKGLADRVLLTGMISHLFLIARGHRVGKATIKIMEGKGLNALLPRAEALLNKYGEMILTPSDVSYLKGDQRVETSLNGIPDDAPIYDIGESTIEEYSKILKEAKTVIMRGPAGYIEDPRFTKGSEKLLLALVGGSAVSLLGGGHLRAISERLGIADKIGYFSTGGGAFITFLSGDKLPALEVLIASKQKFRSDR
ncbi:MAG: phosphoglycerate kinase [Candidatus Verstraetearchaeota archaeon]|nr:phosphoglycerate kinase [Candidatus Verstraetearchaeota archaeon]